VKRLIFLCFWVPTLVFSISPSMFHSLSIGTFNGIIYAFSQFFLPEHVTVSGICEEVLSGNEIIVQFDLPVNTRETLFLVGADVSNTKKMVEKKDFPLAFTKNNLEGKKVWVEFHWKSEDDEGRIPAFVWLPVKTIMGERYIQWNLALLLNGMAEVCTDGLDLEKLVLFREAFDFSVYAKTGLMRYVTLENPSIPDEVDEEILGLFNKYLNDRNPYVPVRTSGEPSAVGYSDYIGMQVAGSAKEKLVILVNQFLTEEEILYIENRGTVSENLQGWTIKDTEGNSFSFAEEEELDPGETVMVSSGARASSKFVWSTSPIWNDDSDVAQLYNPEGELVSLCVYSQGSTQNGRDAYEIAKEVLKFALKAPSTAEFPEYQEDMVKEMGGTYLVNSFVDSENSFSAKLRKQFNVEMEFIEEGIWLITSYNLEPEK